MGRKARQKDARETLKPAEEKASAETAKREVEAAEVVPPMSGGLLQALLFAAACATVAFVGLWFELTVNRVFDVPKALALKVGGSGAFLVWLLYGLFGGGYPWRSVRLFLAPVVALLGVVGISTALSIDPWMSLYGVYERQFGFQGLLSCGGLFLVAATCLRSRRGAVFGFAVLALVGGVIGSYSVLQATGHDPFGFFSKPHNKVYSTLGNATFAGNALALIFPMTAMLAIVAAGYTLRRSRWERVESERGVGLAGWAVAFAAMLALQILPGYYSVPVPAANVEPDPQVFKLGVGASLVFALFLAAIGSWGFEWARLETRAGRLIADATAAGTLAASSVAIFIGLFTTRTRGAWVGTLVAIAGGFVLVPMLYRDRPETARKMRTIGLTGLAAFLLLIGGLLVMAPNHIFSRTLRSIPHAFNPEHTVYGQGQGTRRYLWVESVRVLFDHDKTLARQDKDRLDVSMRARSLGAKETPPERSGLERALRRVLVWPFGIGIESYRYAFMSHKSKKLEALDPMTNHDNPHNNYLYMLASCGILGLAAYLWMLWRLISTAWKNFRGEAVLEGEAGESTRPLRALSFGVVMSFLSYTVYSIAGFDSVACSVFFYFLLGCAAVLFAPTLDEPARPILVQIHRQWREWRKRSLPATYDTPKVMAAVLAAGLGGLLLHTVVAAYQVHDAEEKFVGEGFRTYNDKIAAIERAIEENPRESYYRQNLGSTLGDAARQYRDAAARAQSEGKGDAAAYMQKAREYHEKAKASLYKSLDHAWAPENVFISLFQVYYAFDEMPEAELALERALEHSPHLGAVRANLAVLKLQESKNYEGAMKDCKWVLEVDPTYHSALRTCCKASIELEQYEEAKGYCDRAIAKQPNDSTTKQYLRELEEKTRTSTK